MSGSGYYIKLLITLIRLIHLFCVLAGDEIVILSMEKADGDFVVFYLLDWLNFFKIVFIFN